MARKSMAELQAEHDAAMADLAEQMKLEIKKRDGVIANLEGLVSSAEKGRAHQQKRALDAEADNDNLRDLLHAAEMELSRREGYMQAIDDAQPPVMMPVPRDKQAVRHIGDGSGTEYSTDTWRGTTRAPWYRRRLP